jgi:hypothetical protein
LLPSGIGCFFPSSSRVFVGVGVGVNKMALTCRQLPALFSPGLALSILVELEEVD